MQDTIVRLHFLARGPGVNNIGQRLLAVVRPLSLLSSAERRPRLPATKSLETVANEIASLFS